MADVRYSGSVKMGSMGSWEPINFLTVSSEPINFGKKVQKSTHFFVEKGQEVGIWTGVAFGNPSI